MRDPTSNNGDYIDVPVLVKNQPGNESDTDTSGWKLVRRFFLYDTVSGIEAENQQPRIIRYAAKTKLIVRLQTSNAERIFVPIFSIEYN